MKKCCILLGALLTFFGNMGLATPISLQPISVEQLREQLLAYRPDIIVADLWASWCTPCIKRFPHMVALHKKYQRRHVRIISVNLDDHNDRESLQWAERFLMQQNATFDHYRIDENLMDAFAKLSLTSIPAVLIFDRSGIERYRLTSNNPSRQFTETDVETAIEVLLNEQTTEQSITSTHVSGAIPPPATSALHH